MIIESLSIIAFANGFDSPICSANTKFNPVMYTS